jgi:uncharacterized protein (TIGR02145 family)
VYPKCNRQEYSPDSLFCFGDVLYEMCNGQTYNASTHECRNGVLTEKAQFTGHTLTVKVEPEGAGEVTRVPDATHYGVGTYVNVTAVAKDGWRFDRWSGALTLRDNSLTVHIIGDLELTANFQQFTPKTVVINGKTWMAENLNIPTTDSWCYGEGGPVIDSENSDWNNGIYSFITLSEAEIQANCAIYGRLYTWDAAMAACPAGWHLPTRREWDSLIIAAGGNVEEGEWGSETGAENLKSQSWDNGTNLLGFSALPGGGRLNDGSYGELGSYGVWWTATEYDITVAYYQVIVTGEAWVGSGRDNVKNDGFSVRCVKDD